MIKVGIIGADSPMAGELIRILVNHPDVELIAAQAPSLCGRSVASVHHGLTGELDLEFTDSVNPVGIDVVFLDSHSETAETYRSNSEDGISARYPELKIIDMSHAPSLDFDELGMVYGLPEINRKRLVRGATRALVPRSIAGVSVISLFPLASHLLLNSEIKIKVECPDDLAVSEKLERALNETVYILKRIQNSHKGNISLERTASSGSARSLRLEIETECPVRKEELERIYSETYDDHNFTLISPRPMAADEVEGTDKCIISLNASDSGKLIIETVADCRMRGGAGDAVHIMNLMFGLHEKTGLYLKAHKY